MTLVLCCCLSCVGGKWLLIVLRFYWCAHHGNPEIWSVLQTAAFMLDTCEYFLISRSFSHILTVGWEIEDERKCLPAFTSWRVPVNFGLMCSQSLPVNADTSGLTPPASAATTGGPMVHSGKKVRPVIKASLFRKYAESYWELWSDSVWCFWNNPTHRHVLLFLSLWGLFWTLITPSWPWPQP